MSYTPENEDLKGPVSEIIDGIQKFKVASLHRKNGGGRWSGGGEWGVEHLAELTRIENMLNDVELALRVLIR
ncbi:hypothetical protein KKF61_08870 [Patescibacteria group bacterium]|nr:hypothetical protein [Patescibacteria group bacterium]